MAFSNPNEPLMMHPMIRFLFLQKISQLGEALQLQILLGDALGISSFPFWLIMAATERMIVIKLGYFWIE